MQRNPKIAIRAPRQYPAIRRCLVAACLSDAVAGYGDLRAHSSPDCRGAPEIAGVGGRIPTFHQMARHRGCQNKVNFPSMDDGFCVRGPEAIGRAGIFLPWECFFSRLRVRLPR